MAYVKQLKDVDTGDAIFPVTHVDAVINGNGSNVSNLLNAKQNTLVSGTNIKTVNSTSLLGSGNIAVQPTLVSGTNIKTINNVSLLGSGNVNLDSSTLYYEGQGTNYVATGDTLGEAVDELSDAINNKQATLVSGTNIKTINGTSLLGSGDVINNFIVTITQMTPIGGGTPSYTVSSTLSSILDKINAGFEVVCKYGIYVYQLESYDKSSIRFSLTDAEDKTVETFEITRSGVTLYSSSFQDILVSGTNIKTINSTSLLGSGNITINGGTLAYTGVDLYDTETGGTIDDEIDALDARKAREITFTKKTDSTSITFTTSSQIYGRRVYCLSSNATTWQTINSLTFNTGSFNTVQWTQITPTIGETLPAVGDRVSEYCCLFFAGVNDMPITFPSNVKWENGEKPTIKANDFCELTIRNGIASLRKTVIR